MKKDLILISAGYISAMLVVIFFKWFFINYTIEFQTPIKIQPFVIIKEAKPIEIINVLPENRPVRPVLTPTPTKRPLKKTIAPFKKFLTDNGAETREKVLAIVSAKYAGDELMAFDNIMKKEAGYRLDAINEIGCGGMPQACPASKMNCPLDDSGLECQTNWVMNYIENRYGNPTTAWNFHLAHNYY